MNEQDVLNLTEKTEEIRDSQQDISRNITGLLNIISNMEKQFDKDYNLSFVLAGLREKLQAIDTDEIFTFIDDIEDEIENLSYNYRRAKNANNISIYKIKQ